MEYLVFTSPGEKAHDPIEWGLKLESHDPT